MEKNVVFFQQAQSAHPSDRIECLSSIQYLPLQGILYSIVLKIPDILAELGLVHQIPLSEGLIVAIQSPLKGVPSQTSVELLVLVIQPGHLTPVDYALLHIASTIQRADRISALTVTVLDLLSLWLHIWNLCILWQSILRLHIGQFAVVSGHLLVHVCHATGS